MKWLKEILAGVILLLLAMLLERELRRKDAAKNTLIREGEACALAGHPPSHFQHVLHREGKMRRSFMWYVNSALLVVLLAVLSCSVGGCSTGRNASQPAPEQAVVITPLIQNHLDFLYFAIAEKGGLEAWFCMIGYADDKSVFIQGLAPIWVDSADEANIVGHPRGCEGPNTIGTIHFHPGIGYCELSGVDISTAHHLPWPTAAIVCKDKSGARPRVEVMWRKEIDRNYSQLVRMPRGESRTFVATYRYKRPP